MLRQTPRQSGAATAFVIAKVSHKVTTSLNMRLGRFVSKWVPVIAWMVLMFAGSTDVLSAEHTSRFLVPFLRWLDPTISLQGILAIHSALRKIGHFTEYAILAVLLWRALRGTFGGIGKGILTTAAFLVCAGFAASDEFHQSFVATRTASAHDVIIDCIGAFVAVLLCVIFSRARAQQESRSGFQPLNQ
jgi:VanZ family protein